MKKHFIIFTFVALVFGLLFLPVSAAVGDSDVDVPEEAINEVITLSFKESIELAFENNTRIGKAEIAVEKAEMELKQAERRAMDIRDLTKFTGYTYDLMMAERVMPLVREMSMIVNEKTLDFTKSLIEFQVEAAYYDVLKAEKEIQNALDSLNRAKEQQRLAEVGLEIGVNSKLDVLNAEILVASRGVALSHAENNLEEKRMDFCLLVGLPIDSRIRLTSRFSFAPAEFDLEEVAENAREINLNYIIVHEDYKVKKETYKLADQYYPPNVATYQEAKFDYETAILDLKTADDELDIEIAKAYNMTQSAKDRYKLMEKSVEQARESYRLTKLRYEVGMSTLLELENTAGELDKAEAEMLGALYDYNLAVTMLRHGIFGVGGGN